MTNVLQPYQVALINNDLTANETLFDVFHSLDHLSSIVTEIFQRIESRVNDEKNRLNQIKARVDVCGQKVQQIRGSNQAITVFSTAKFPAPKQLPLYPALLGQKSVVSLINKKMLLEIIFLM
jgi:WAS protein family homolog 1